MALKIKSVQTRIQLVLIVFLFVRILILFSMPSIEIGGSAMIMIAVYIFYCLKVRFHAVHAVQRFHAAHINVNQNALLIVYLSVN